MDVGPPIHELHFSDSPDVDDPPGPQSKRLIERQLDVDSSAIAYPKRLPFAIDAARGATIRDVDGNVFLDFFGGIGVMNVGHSNPYVLEGVTRQMERAVHTIDFPTQARLDLIETLDEIAPGSLSGNSRVVFGGPTGSDVIEGTIKLAKDNTGGSGLISFRGGYHGTTPGALSLTSAKAWKEDYTPLLPDVVHAPYPYPFRDESSPAESVERSLSEVRQILEDPHGGLANPAGIWVEPIQGTGGVVVPPEGFLSGLQEIAAENGIPLVVDEIQTGLGRTGKWFASEWDDVTPDAIPMAKALGGIGLPLSATLYDESLDTWEAGSHVGTFRGNAPAMIGGVRAIEYIEGHDLLSHAQELGEYIRTRLGEAAAGSEFVGEVRGKGLFIGAEFVTDEGAPNPAFLDEVQESCFREGVLVWTAGRHAHVLRLLPPLVITKEQAIVACDTIVNAIEDATESHRGR